MKVTLYDNIEVHAFSLWNNNCEVIIVHIIDCHRFKQGLYRSLKCLKALEIHHCFFKAFKSFKNSTFWSSCLKVLEFPLSLRPIDRL